MQMNKKGFTLVELLMVVIIIGILVTLAVPNYFKAVERVKGSKGKAALDMIRKAELQYRAVNDTFTLATADLAEFDYNENSITIDNDWDYAVTTADATNLLVEATRTGGSSDGNTITIDQDGDVVTTVPEWMGK